ncbi:hypothetical protein [Microtetraspora glauca]|uniref:Uncharacterized protein n=1 Tax=Microtetraspora glauca TaxID=1996 RepID=A0ABV3GAL4_MICGL
MTPDHEQRAHELTGGALSAAVANLDDLTEAAEQVAALYTECGPEGIGYAVLAWCDTLIAHTDALSNAEGATIRLSFLDAETGIRSENADDVPPVARWAAQLIVARARLDEAMYEALWAALPEDAGEQVIGLLHLVAVNLRHAHAGGPQ